jgi:beta-lactamase regulating signal transducer with metallopeptidase domain
VNELHAIAAAVAWVLGDNHAGFSAAFAQFARAASPVAARAVIDAMWQGTAVAVGLLVLLRLAPRVNAAHRFVAWSAGFAAVAALPLLPWVARFFSGSAAAAQISVANGSMPRFELDSRWALWIAALWLIASALRLAEFFFHSLRLRKLWKTATPVAEGNAASLVAFAGGRGSAEICTTRELDRPSVIGFFAPRILIPDWLYARLTPQELSQVVMHEAEHLRRHDDWTNLIQKFFLVLFPLNPALAWMERRLCREREMACDEGVVRRTQAPRAYAACLAGLAEHGLDRDLERRPAALSLAAWRRRPELVHRVHGILSRRPALNLAASRVLLSAVGCGLLAASVELARCPQVVAFVAAPVPQQLAQADAVNTDRAAYVPAGLRMSSEQGPHMVEANAILAPAAIAPASTNSASRRRTDSVETPRSKMAAGGARVPRETLLSAEDARVEQATRQAAQSQPQYIVLTAWEQVQTVPQEPRTIADYDNGAESGANPQTTPAAATAENPRAASAAPQMTVTRLIFRIAPESRTPAAKSDSGNNSSTTSNSIQQPTLIPIGNGWLVLQL